MTVRTRFAPSPTGFMHIGGVRTALFAWLFARQNNGQFILRIEDTDKEREVEGSIGHIMESLRWLGIEWDEGPDNGGPFEPYVQSARLELYKTYAQKLIDSGFAYPDPYTSEEVEAFRKKAEAAKKPFLFRGHRPETTEIDADWYGTKPLRFKVPVIKRYEWHDLVYGDLSAGEEALDDFILIKSDGYPTYNFCHVIDDIEMQVTHVMRGQEFISSTPKFLSLYDALELPPPQFATLPPILGEGGNKKLGKRDGAKDLLEYRAEGYLPEAMVNYLALIGWNPGTDQEFFSRDELIREFSIERIQHSGGQFDEEKLLHINQYWMRQLPDELFIEQGALAGAVPGGEQSDTIEKLRTSVPLLKERAQTFSEARDMLSGELRCLFERPEITEDLLRKNEPKLSEIDPKSVTKEALEAVLGLLEGVSGTISPDSIKELLMPLADAHAAKGKEFGGRGAILWPLRYALSGQEKSPDPFSIISIVGIDESILRIKNALAILG